MNKVVYNAAYGGYALSDEAIEMLKAKGYDNPYDIERHNPDLVEIVEVLGKKASNSKNGSRLVIGEIKEDSYYIDEYDGYEAIITPKHMEKLWVKINND